MHKQINDVVVFFSLIVLEDVLPNSSLEGWKETKTIAKVSMFIEIGSLFT